MEHVVMGVFLNFTITENVADVLLVRLHARHDELLLFLPVDKGADTRDDQYGNENSSALNPSVLTLMRSG